MDIREQIRGAVTDAMRGMLGETPIPQIAVDSPKVKDHGDYATNVALSLAKVLGRKPLDIANDIAANIKPGGVISKVEVKPPGFINFFVADSSLAAGLVGILKAGKRYGWSEKFKGRKAIVEFVSANPTGPLHIGHARNAAVGDCIARALERAGYEVWREYYFNDAGVQMNRLGESVKARYLQIFETDVTFPDDGYHGDYIGEIAAELHKEVGESWKGHLGLDFASYAEKRVIALIDADMEALHIHFDLKFSEAGLHKDGSVDRTLEQLKAANQTYEQDGAVWLRTSDAGDEKDRVLVKTDGEKTYLAPDIAYHDYKYRRGFDLIVDLLGADHHSYVIRLRAAMKALGHDPEKLNCLIYQLVTVKRGGEVVKFGKRAGDYITVREMIEELGSDVVRFFFNMRKSDSHMVFDWDLAKEQSVKNPVYYIQYAHARCCSIERKVGELGMEFAGAEACDLSLLNAPEEQKLIRTLYEFPRIVEVSGAALEPHHYTTYLREVAEQFNSYFTAGNVNEEMRVILPENLPLMQSRLALIFATRVVLRNALEALGISAPEKM